MVIKSTDMFSVVASDSIGDVLDEIIWQIYPNHSRDDGKQYLISQLQDNPKVKQAMRDVLNNMGISGSVKVIGAGLFSVTFEAGDKLLIRLSHALKEGRRLFNFPPTVLQPLFSCDLGKINPALYGLHMDVMPRVTTGYAANITDDEMRGLIKDTMGYKQVFFDAAPENVGRLADGTPIIIDLGAVKFFDAANESRAWDSDTIKRLLGLTPEERNQSLQKWLGIKPKHDYTASQRDHVMNIAGSDEGYGSPTWLQRLTCNLGGRAVTFRL